MRIALLLLALTIPAVAQTAPCVGLTSVSDTTQLIYPPIAKAAQLQADVNLSVAFNTSGTIDKIDIVSGPLMLQAAATNYVKGWHANEYSGPRSCSVVIRFRLLPAGSNKPDTVVRDNLQHVTITATAPFIDVHVVHEPTYTPGAQVQPSTLYSGSNGIASPANSPRRATIAMQLTSASKASSLPRAFARTPRESAA